MEMPEEVELKRQAEVSDIPVSGANSPDTG